MTGSGEMNRRGCSCVLANFLSLFVCYCHISDLFHLFSFVLYNPAFSSDDLPRIGFVDWFSTAFLGAVIKTALFSVCMYSISCDYCVMDNQTCLHPNYSNKRMHNNDLCLNNVLLI